MNSNRNHLSQHGFVALVVAAIVLQGLWVGLLISIALWLFW